MESHPTKKKWFSYLLEKWTTQAKNLYEIPLNTLQLVLKNNYIMPKLVYSVIFFWFGVVLDQKVVQVVTKSAEFSKIISKLVPQSSK